jgi:DNA-binding NtrC family response regulator
VVERQTLLVVEDEGTIRRTIADLLIDEGYSVVAVGDLRSALVVLQRHSVTAVVLDWRLVDDTAEPILEHLARVGAATAVVLVSAAPECAATALRYQVPFIKKPMNLEVLTAVLGRAIRDGSSPRLSIT